MNKSESITKLSESLAAAQAAMPMIPFDSQNPFLKNKYASLGAVIEHSRPILKEHGLSVVQLPFKGEDGVGIETVLLHTSGEFISERISIPMGEERGKSMAQVAGSIITYLRRYAWASVLGLYSDEDTDGQPPEKKSSATASRPAPASRPAQTGPPATAATAPRPAPRAGATAPAATAQASKTTPKQRAAEKEAAERADNERRKAKFLAMVDTACQGNLDFAKQLFIEMGILLDTEEVADFPFQHLPKTQQEADSILEEIATRAGVDYIPGAIPETPAPSETQEPMIDYSDQLSVAGYIKKVMEKETAKGNTRYSILVVEDMDDTKGGWWIATFDSKDGEKAKALVGEWKTLYYEESKFGKDLLKRGIQ